jgi:multiple sugar transport system ATP-binding protein
MAGISLRKVSKRWGSFIGVHEFDLEIADKEFLVLLGPSGCGKTTTMRMIAGLEQVTSGEIWIGDRKVNKLEPKDRDVAMVFQSYGLYPNMTVWENIRFPLKVRKVDPATHEQRVQHAVDMVELNEFTHRRPAELSGGQRQRVALARAIVREPTVFLMDEPLSNLDAKLRVSTRAQIKNLQDRLATTTIYVTHDQIEAMTLADRVVVMNTGVVQQVGTPVDIYDRPANTFVAGFIGSPAMNLIDGHIEDGVFRTEHVSIGGFHHVAGPVTLGFRAEDAVIVEADTHTAPNLSAPVYSMELLGEASMVTMKLGEALVSIKAGKEYRAQIGQGVHAQIDASMCHLFDQQSGQRLGDIT